MFRETRGPSVGKSTSASSPSSTRLWSSIARQERRSLPQVVRQLLEDGLRLRADAHTTSDDTAGREIARLAATGGAFDWLDEEPDLYDDGDGEHFLELRFLLVELCHAINCRSGGGCWQGLNATSQSPRQ